MLGSDDEELLAVRARFCMVIARWMLTQAEVGGLLGLGADDAVVGRVLPDVLDVRAETALRLLVRADDELVRRMPAPGELAEWLRTGAIAYGGRSPLAAFCDLPDLRAVVRVLEGGPR